MSTRSEHVPACTPRPCTRPSVSLTPPACSPPRRPAKPSAQTRGSSTGTHRPVVHTPRASAISWWSAGPGVRGFTRRLEPRLAFLALLEPPFQIRFLLGLFLLVVGLEHDPRLRLNVMERADRASVIAHNVGHPVSVHVGDAHARRRHRRRSHCQRGLWHRFARAEGLRGGGGVAARIPGHILGQRRVARGCRVLFETLLHRVSEKYPPSGAGAVASLFALGAAGAGEVDTTARHASPGRSASWRAPA